MDVQGREMSNGPFFSPQTLPEVDFFGEAEGFLPPTDTDTQTQTYTYTSVYVCI